MTIPSRYLLVGAILFLGLLLPAMNTHRSSAFAAAPSAIDRAALLHNSWDLAYRQPFGAVPAGTAVRLRLRTAHSGATSVTLYVSFQKGEDLGTDRVTAVAKQPLGPLSRGARYDVWQASFKPTSVGIYIYRFLVKQGSASIWYSTSPYQLGGTGRASSSSRAAVGFHLTSYARDFQAVSWAKSAVIYQIFPDRFFNGDPSNDRLVQDPQYGGTAPFCGPHPIIHTNESDTPVNNCDFFGGDLQGIIDKLPYLQDMGVTALYLNPIFMATSNHKYDTSDYYRIDPHFGTMKTFTKLVEAAHANGMHLILDGVFNHTGSDSVYFNRYGAFNSVGAYQSQSSPYSSFYAFTRWPDSYDMFFGVDTLPALQENNAVKDFIFLKPDSVAPHWLAVGADGWRLDAASSKSHGWWQQFRLAVKARFPDDIIICECTQGDVNNPIDATPWLLGNEVDGAMNYRFRYYLGQFFARGVGQIPPLEATGFYQAMQSMLEEYPRPALLSSMSLVGSHDTDRITSLLPGNSVLQEQIAAFQMTWLGAPTIYYGDEAGLQGVGNPNPNEATDPPRRRFFPWSHQDTALEAVYRKLIAIRHANPALQDGTVSPLVLDDAHRVFAFLRKDASQSVAVIFNAGALAGPPSRSVTIQLSGLQDGARLTDAVTGKTYTLKGKRVTVPVAAAGYAILTP